MSTGPSQEAIDKMRAEHAAQREALKQDTSRKQVMRLDRGTFPGLQNWDEFNASQPRRPYLIKGLIQAGSLFALTGFTGHAKTTVTLHMALMMSRGITEHFGCLDHEIRRQGTTVYICGENPANVRDQWLACCIANGTTPDKERVIFVPGRFDHEHEMEKFLQALGDIDDLALVIVDTLQAFFMGEDDNSNAAMGAFARSWSPVCNLPSMPTVIINCHPAGKSANDAKENLVPRGGGAFLGEIDANLSVYRDGDEVTVHWAGKFRGQYPEPIKFTLEDVCVDELKDDDGNDMPMAVLRIQTQQSRSEKFRENVHRMERVLFRIHLGQKTSEGALSDDLGINKRQVRNLIDEMIAKKVVKRNAVGGGLALTRTGKSEIVRIEEERGAKNAL